MALSPMENELQVRQALVDTYNNYAQGLDSKDWPLVRASFADEVLIDYGSISSPSGDPAIPRSADDWLTILQGVINGFDITRHTITNHRVAIVGTLVSCRAYLTADHVIFPDAAVPVVGDQDVVTVVGEYTNYYKQTDNGWKICKSELAVNWSRGNIALFTAASERVMAQLRG
ncbi:MAG: nuclear transport factor 2 family protein [Halioglobus sp.]